MVKHEILFKPWPLSDKPRRAAEREVLERRGYVSTRSGQRKADFCRACLVGVHDHEGEGECNAPVAPEPLDHPCKCKVQIATEVP